MIDLLIAQGKAVNAGACFILADAYSWAAGSLFVRLSGVSIFFTALIGAFLGCAIFIFAFIALGFSLPAEPKTSQANLSLTPGMDALDDFSCPKGQTKIIKTLGIEDNFARAGDEPAEIRPSLLDFPLYADHYYEKSHLLGFRDFDERGLDSVLMTYMEFPEKIDSGLFVTKVKYLAGSQNDSLSIADLMDRIKNYQDFGGFGVSLNPEGSADIQVSKLISLNFAELKGDPAGPHESLLSYLKTQKTNHVMDISIGDDMVVDFIGVVMCQSPLDRKGTTMAVDSRGIFSENAMLIGCNSDPHQKICDPHAGDNLCSTEVPLGCYREGNAPPMNIQNDFIQSKYVGGSIEVTKPVAGDKFGSLMEASEFCTKSFGPDWRVLSFHEGGGQFILAHGGLTPKTRMWVDVKDYPAANCWTNGSAQEAERE